MSVVGGQVVPVYTAYELQQEVELGTPHIVIQDHLDLNEISAAPHDSFRGQLLVVRNTTLSIRVRPRTSASWFHIYTRSNQFMIQNTSHLKFVQGNCTAAPRAEYSAPPIRALGSGQCVLSVSAMFARMPQNGSLWMDNIHIRVDRPWEEKRKLVALLQPTAIGHRLFLTSVTLQGDAPEGQTRGLDVKDGARVYAQGVHQRPDHPTRCSPTLTLPIAQ